MNSWTPADTTALAVLSLLKLGPNHGYGLRAILESWQIHRWLDVKYGAIYASLKRLDGRGLVEVVGVESANGPARTTYRLTPDGEAELAALARRGWSASPQWSMPIDLLVMHLGYDWIGHPVLARTEVIMLLQQRADHLEQALAELHEIGEGLIELTDLGPLRRLQQVHFDHGIELLRAELRWTRDLVASVQRGDFDVP